MAIELFHHPFSRAATVVWMLEEIGVPYTLRFVDFASMAHKSAEMIARNPMGKLPTLVDDGQVVTETAAIGLYLADRYALGRLAPATDDPTRGTYLRWSLYAPSVIEPGCAAHAGKWEARASAVGWGTYAHMLETITAAIHGGASAADPGPWLLGARFTMADVIFGATVRYMRRFDMLDATPAITEYIERISDRPAARAADAINARVVAERGLGR
jgi:glutathione S-transferase